MLQQVSSMLCNSAVCWFAFLLPVPAIRELRVADAENQIVAWEQKTYITCLHEVAEVTCDGHEQVMEVVSAVYNRNTKAGDKVCGSYYSDWNSCEVNAKAMVQRRCHGSNVCHLLPSDHASCEGKAFKQMRLVVRCKAADEDTMTRTSDETPTTQVDANEDTRMIVNNDHNLSEIALVPCYRSLALGKLVNGDVLSDTWRAEFSSSVTACESKEGCFHLSFPDGLAYTNSNEPPTTDELVKGELKEVSETMRTTQGVGLQKVDYGIGLKYNDYGTWGICLPRVPEAAALWQSEIELRNIRPLLQVAQPPETRF